MKKLKKVGIVLFWLIVWQIMSVIIDEPLLFASPIDTLYRLSELILEKDFWQSVSLSLQRIMLGFLLAFVVSIVLAAVSSKMKILHDILSPLFNVVKATPVASFIILALVWVRSDYLSTVISFLMVVPMIYTNLYQGIKQIDKNLLEMAYVFNMSTKRIVKEIYFPSIWPYIVSSCTVGLGFAWKSGVAAEVIGLPNKTIGIHLYDAKVYLETTDLFAWTFVIVLLSVFFEKIIMALLKAVQKV